MPRLRRPQLKAAIKQCRDARAKLVIAKLDRLARNVRFFLELMDSGVGVVFSDLPETRGPMGRFLLTSIAAVAELEAGLISERTKAALAAAKARGTRLGNPDLLADPKGFAAIREEKARLRHLGSHDIVEAMRGAMGDGHTTLRALRDELNQRGIPTPRGGRWHLSTVHSTLQRLKSEAVQRF